MPGLLDFLTGDDAAMGLGLLAAGGPTTDPNRSGFGQRLQGAVQSVQAQKDAQLRNKLLQSQIDENVGQAAMRQQQLAMAKRKMDMQSGLLGYPTTDASGGSMAAASPGVPPALATPPGAGMGAPSAPSTPGGAAGSGGGMPPPQTPVGTPNGPMTLAQISQQYQIPYQALAFDLVNNDGKGIAEMVFKRGAPDMQVTNGYAYDKNRQQPGYLPQLNISSNGQATQVQIGPDGQPVVSAPQGAVNTFGAYQNAQGQAAANWQEGTPTFNAQGQKVILPRADLLNSSRTPVALPGRPLGAVGPGYAGGSAAAAAGGQVEIMASELQKAQQELAAAQQRGDAAGVARAQSDVAGIQRELQRLPGAGQAMGPPTQPMIGPGVGRGTTGTAAAPMVSAGNVVELSPQQQAQNEANKTRMVDTAKADVVRDTGQSADAKKAGQMRAAAQSAMALLNAGPTASGVGAMADTALNFIGQPTASGTAAQQLEAIGGALVSNVPRMEGPQSDRDVQNYQAMAGRIGDRTLPVEARKAALRTVIELQNKYAALNGGGAGVGAGAGAAPSTPAAPALPAGWTVKVK